MQTSDSRVVPHDAALRRQILELARAHDERLKELEQDLVRAETKLKVEQRWRWFDRLICFGVGFGLAALAWQSGFAGQMITAAQAGAADLLAYLASTVDIYGLPVPLNAIVFLGASVIVALAIGAIRSLQPSPKSAARELLKRVESDPAVQGLIFTNGTLPKSSFQLMQEEQGFRGEEVPEPTLERQLQHVLQPPSAVRRTLQ